MASGFTLAAGGAIICACAEPAERTALYPIGRPVKITLGEMRSTGIRGLIIFCADYRCSHNITLPPAYVDRWPDTSGFQISSRGSGSCARSAVSAAPISGENPSRP